MDGVGLLMEVRGELFRCEGSVLFEEAENLLLHRARQRSPRSFDRGIGFAATDSSGRGQR